VPVKFSSTVRDQLLPLIDANKPIVVMMSSGRKQGLRDSDQNYYLISAVKPTEEFSGGSGFGAIGGQVMTGQFVNRREKPFEGGGSWIVYDFKDQATGHVYQINNWESFWSEFDKGASAWSSYFWMMEEHSKAGRTFKIQVDDIGEWGEDSPLWGYLNLRWVYGAPGHNDKWTIADARILLAPLALSA